MKFRQVKYLPLVLMLLALVACGNPQEEARAQLGRKNIDFDTDSFINRAQVGDVEAVKLFLQAGMKPNFVTGRGGQTPLANAARYNRQEVVQVLLAHGADPNARSMGSTALIWASINGSNDLVRLLLDRGADLKATDRQHGMNALQCAAMAGKADTVKLLLDRGAEVNSRDRDGKTALIWAAHYGRDETVQVLLNHGADVSLKENIQGLDALLAAASRGHTVTVKLLLEKGADINARDRQGQTALMMAARGWPEIVRLLVGRGADLNARDPEGHTALSLARDDQRKEVVEILEKAGAGSTAATPAGPQKQKH